MVNMLAIIIAILNHIQASAMIKNIVHTIVMGLLSFPFKCRKKENNRTAMIDITFDVMLISGSISDW
jgi:hypothetical protein